ncbi:MAG TPA: SDR family NAD(P)-dependent oxidoreductase [Caldithrix abyssi]|uniref:SDR family NAD(P)-dependent oxidoreductase n=1 Tax=Caldithrix abyssi TaxID=187145 RepID=A0A7V4U3W3_CALAY|nr:SDR family NAD(P)-dependent oxidoreductase [Caldithrix abyssi]
MELSKSKILVTGAGGFIGSHLVELCCKNGTDVRAFVRYNSKNSWGWLESSPCKNDIEIITGDIRDYDSVRKAVEGCSTVFHLAALIGIPYSYESPIAYVKTNIEGTYNVLEAAKAEQCQNILVTSTSETYGSAQYVPIDEKHPMVGQSPYSATKIGADHLALSYFRSFDLPVKIVRPFNTYGPRQSARAIIPTTITQILSGNTQLRLGNTSPTRDLTFVKDTAEGFWEIARSDHLFGEITNIGMGKEISIGELVRLIAELMDVEVTIITEEERVRPDKSEVMRLLCDSSKIRAKTEWRPAYDLRKGLLETIEWLKYNQHLYKPEIYNV